MKIVINSCFGGFSLSHKAILRYAELKGITLYIKDDKWLIHYFLVPIEEYNKLKAEDEKNGNYKLSNEAYFSDRDIERNDPALIQVVEELGKEADDNHANLKVIEIPDDVKWQINEYDGSESIHEEHRSWS